eukprot:1147835-Pelagomonas_calceolata.AAC.1
MVGDRIRLPTCIAYAAFQEFPERIQHALPPVHVEDNQAFFMVDHIAGHKPRTATCHAETTRYFINSTGYPSWENTEEPAIAKDVPGEVAKYLAELQQHSSSPSSAPAPAPAPQPSPPSSFPSQRSLQPSSPADPVSCSDPPRISNRKSNPRLLLHFLLKLSSFVSTRPFASVTPALLFKGGITLQHFCACVPTKATGQSQ